MADHTEPRGADEAPAERRPYVVPTLRSLGRVRFIAPRSPHNLLLEDFTADPFRLAIASAILDWRGVFLLKKEEDFMSGVLVEFFRRFPDAGSMWKMAEEPTFVTPVRYDIQKILHELDVSTYVITSLRDLAKLFVCARLDEEIPTARHLSILPSISPSIIRAYEMFCLGNLGLATPTNAALRDYWSWAILHPDVYATGWSTHPCHLTEKP